MKYIVLFMCLFSLTFGDEFPHQNLDEGALWQKVNDDDDDKREVADENDEKDTTETPKEKNDSDEGTDNADDDDDDDDDDADDMDDDTDADDDEDMDDDEGTDDDADDDEDMDDDENASDKNAGDDKNAFDKNSPLKVTINKSEGAVVVGQQLIYTVTVTNVSDYEVQNVKLVLTASFGIDPVEVLSSATSLVEDDEVEEDGIIFEPFTNLKSYQAIEYQISCDLFNFYRGEDDNHPVSAIVYYNVGNEAAQRKTIAHGKHFEVIAAPYLETNVDSKEGFVDTGQELNYSIEISNIGPIDAENVVVMITYDAQQLQVEDIKAPCDVVLHAAGRIKLAEYPRLKAVDLYADEQEALVINIKGKAMISGYASGLHVIARVGNKEPVKTISAKVKKEDIPTVKGLKLRKAIFKERKNNNRRWDIGWKKGILPDSFVVISVAENGNWVKKFTSQVMKNNLRPIWEIDTQIQVAPQMKIKIDVFDKDLKKHDTIGSHTFVVDEKVFAQKDLEFSFAGVEKIYLSLEDGKE